MTKRYECIYREKEIEHVEEKSWEEEEFYHISGGSVLKNLPANAEDSDTQVQPLDWEDPLEEGMATHSSILD